MMLPLFVAAATASNVYPTELADIAGMPCVPTCTVCHETNGGGTGTVSRAFGQAVMARGLTGDSNLDGLGAAFDQLVADAVDSDGDGTPDADELAEGGDPNPDATPFCGEDVEPIVQPEYGCFNTSQSPIGLVAALGGFLAVALGRRR
jgi:hypothetical protein